jgi:hypothetical protein
MRAVTGKAFIMREQVMPDMLRGGPCNITVAD